MEKESHLIQQPLGRTHILDDDGAREAAQLLFLIARERAARIDDDGRKRHLLSLGHALEQLVAAQVRQTQIEHQAIERRLLQLLQRLAGRGHCGNLHPVTGQQVLDTEPLALVVLHDQQSAHALLQLALQLLECLHQLLAHDGFERIADRSEAHRLLAEVRHRDDVHRHVSGRRTVLELVQDLQPRPVRKIHVQNHGVHLESLRRRQCISCRLRGDTEKAKLVGQLAKHACKVHVILDYQECARVSGEAASVVVHLRGPELPRSRACRWIPFWHKGRGGSFGLRHAEPIPASSRALDRDRSGVFFG